MQEHTRSHRTESMYPYGQESKKIKSKDSVNWRTASKEVFGDIPSTALNLRGLRNREGLTQKEFGIALGLEQSNVSKMELGKRVIGLKIAKRIEEIFDVDYHLFL
jgi:DNA-binding XRE family transcriptional regulator